jgi:ketosteroid isomerase-like protein
MKRLVFVLILVTAVFTGAAMAQGPQGGRGGGGGRGGAPAAPATGPIADLVAKIADAINKGDATTLNSLVTPDAVWVDEDGHFPPVNVWIMRLTSTGPKTMTVLTTPTPLKVQEFGDTAMASFNYSLKETVTPRGQTTGTPNEMIGIASIVFKKTGTDWKAIVIHAAVKGTAVTPH